VLRGGSWNSEATSLRSAARGTGVPGIRSGDRGIRVVAVRTQ